MGTSKGYSMPTGGEWKPLKGEATSFAQEGGSGTVTPASLLGSYVRANGGTSGLGKASGASGSGGAGGGRGRSAAVTTARNLGGFLSHAGAAGLGPALEELGLGHLVGRTPSEVTASLLDALAGPASTLDQAAAREAVAELNDELFKEAETFEEMDQLLKAALDQQGLGAMLQRFFGHYLFARFCRDFYERWERQVGAAQASSSLESIKDFIETSLRSHLVGHDTATINWFGTEGLKLADQVMRETFAVFEISV